LPWIDTEESRHQLDLWGEELRRRLGSGVKDPVPLLTGYLHGELGFDGNRDDYYNHENSLLPMVMENRRGLPLTLSLLYLFVAARAGIEVHGVNLPGHFIARCGETYFAAFALALGFGPVASGMVATLPVLVRATGADPRMGARLGALYATNTAGAIAGALLAGFLLVPSLGLQRSAWLAAGVNLTVALLALGVRGRGGHSVGRGQRVLLQVSQAHVLQRLFVAGGEHHGRCEAGL
jgi:hypothetical protein